MRVVVTRPHGDCAAVVALLSARGHDAVIAPLLSITFDHQTRIDLSGVRAVLLTSANGARALATATTCRDCLLFAVGAATAAAAADAGFNRVISANGDVAGLAGMVRAELMPEGGRLLHVAGQDVAGDLVALLPEFRVERAVLYRALAADSLPDVLRHALVDGAADAVLFYSPRTAATFARLVDSAGLGHHCATLLAVCLSPAVADALQALKFRDIRVAARPDQDSLLAALDAVSIGAVSIGKET